MQAEDADADNRVSKQKADRKSSSAGTKAKKPRKFVIRILQSGSSLALMEKKLWKNFAVLLKCMKLGTFLLPNQHLQSETIRKVSCAGHFSTIAKQFTLFTVFIT